MTNMSILFPFNQPRVEDKTYPGFFNDLNLDLIFDGIISLDKEIDTSSFYTNIPEDLETIRFRQRISQDLMNKEALKSVMQFCKNMDRINRNLNFAVRLENIHNRNGWYLEAMLEYQLIIQEFLNDLQTLRFESEGLLKIKKAMMEIVSSSEFKKINEKAKEIESELKSIRYSLVLKGNTIRIYKANETINLNDWVQSLFSRFDRKEVRDYRSKFSYPHNMNHIETQIIDYIAKLFPKPFSTLTTFISENPHIIDPVIENFNKEIRFYVSYFKYVEFLEKHVSFSLPDLTDRNEFRCDGFFDLALANKDDLIPSKIVTNDIKINENEQFVVITGPNQGGKTTYLRAIGQMYYFAKLGLPVTGRNAVIPYTDSIFTHFEIEESVTTLHGRLYNDMVRIKDILSHATSKSVILINEMLSSTVLHDAVNIYRELMEKISSLGCKTYIVTFIDELSTYNASTVSLVSQVDPLDPTIRTFKIIPAVANGKSFAHNIAEKYGCTRVSIERMIQNENSSDV